MCNNLLFVSCALVKKNLPIFNRFVHFARPFSIMGSIDKALLTGFICRLCSEMHRVVIHIYGVEGLRLGLSEKINKYLPVNVSHSDPLPKTICHVCLERLEGQHRLMLQIDRVRKRLQVPRETRHAPKKKKRN